MTGVVEEANRLRSIAEAGPIGKRHSSFELYELLAQCMKLALECRDPEAREEMRRLISEQPKQGNRRFVEKGSDEYLVVCRYVFAEGRGKAELANSSRYASALRMADKRGLVPGKLVDFLKTQGGINKLFLARPVAAREKTMKALRLTKAITVPRFKPFTITLKMNDEGAFDVVDYEGS